MCVRMSICVCVCYACPSSKFEGPVLQWIRMANIDNLNMCKNKKGKLGNGASVANSLRIHWPGVEMLKQHAGMRLRHATKMPSMQRNKKNENFRTINNRIWERTAVQSHFENCKRKQQNPCIKNDKWRLTKTNTTTAPMTHCIGSILHKIHSKRDRIGPCGFDFSVLCGHIIFFCTNQCKLHPA